MTRSQLVTMLVLVTVICLGSAALLLPERGAADAEPARLVPFAPSEVVSVTVEPTGGAAQRLIRTDADRWVIELRAGADGAGGDVVRWPASIDRVHGFLRILDRLRATPAEPAEGQEPASWIRIESAARMRPTVW